ncbi:MAG TPA: fatty acid-binding protein DegV [Lachnospiraceae bacterium]|nr:fatty acid-binding protein DegV [Lachnospiraceae bacterium]
MIKRLHRRLLNFIRDPEIELTDRIFIAFTIFAEAALILVLIADIILGENVVEVATLLTTVILAPFVIIFAIKAGKLKIAAFIIAIIIVLVILPVSFFFGGGLNGGSVLWFSFCFLYVGLSLRGAFRNILLVLSTLIVIGEYYISYYHRELIVPHGNRMFYYDSAVSVLLNGFIIFTMVQYLIRLFIRENRTVREQAKEIEELNRSQNRFFSSMSHEIRTPINTIIGLNEMILREDVSEEVAEDAANIQSASKLLLALINDILDMSKLSSGQMELTMGMYHPGDMLSDIVGMFWHRAKQKDLEFKVNISPDIPETLEGDEMRIKQILINILNNAIKYTSEGTVSLSIGCDEAKAGKMNVIYTVSDTGMGIKKESIPYLFDAFKRVDEYNNRYIEGTGLGLSIVKQFVDLMGGRITVNSVYTKGSTFIVEIPQSVVGNKKIGRKEINKTDKLKNRKLYRSRFEAPEAKILVVDDNSSNLLVASKLLRSIKVKVDTASSGADALRMTLDDHYDVIFMDHLMPKMDGIECFKQIRAQIGGRCKTSKVVALTANSGSEMAALYEGEGFDGYLIKPVTGENLEAEVLRQLPRELVHITDDGSGIVDETISWMNPEKVRKNVIITSESVADIPDELIKKYDIAILPHIVTTPEGRFKDDIEIEANGLLRYMGENDARIETSAPDVPVIEEFFAKNLTRANNIVHLSISGGLANSGYYIANEAAGAFDNVTVIDSRHLSSGHGILTLMACELKDRGKTPAEIKSILEKETDKIHTSFVVDSMGFLARAGQISYGTAKVLTSLMARPVLTMKNGKLGVKKIYFGSSRHAWEKYIDSVLRDHAKYDKNRLFVTYVGLTRKDMEWIRAYIEKKVHFEKIYFQKASPVIAVNCGPGTFGLLVRDK